VALGVAHLHGWLGWTSPPWLVVHAPEIVAGLLWLSGVLALMLVHPHRSVGAVNVLLALLAVACYAPLGWLLKDLSEMAIAQALAGRLDLWMPRPERTLLRMGSCILVLIIIAGLRPNARVLVARSLALRTGRVDRQTLLAIATAAGICILGDAMGYFSGSMPLGDTLRTVGNVLLLVGGGLLTLGLAGALVDAVRIASAVVAPSPSLRQVVKPAIDAPAADRVPPGSSSAPGEGID
jgi:hypothetical protein